MLVLSMADHTLNRFLRYYKNALIWAFFIFILSIIPVTGRLRFDLLGLFTIDKLAHFVLYSIFCLFIAIGYAKYYSRNYRIKYIFRWSFSVSALFGIVIEIIQPFAMSNRSFDVLDMIANTLGCLGGWLLFKIIARDSYKAGIKPEKK